MRLCFLFLLTALPLLVASDDCTVGTGKLSPCGRHTAILVDNTNYIGSKDRANYVFNFILTILSAYGFDNRNEVYFSIGYYGSSKPLFGGNPWALNFGRKTPGSLCGSFYELETYHEDGNYLGQLNITQAMIKLFEIVPSETSPYDRIIFFSASTDQADVTSAAPHLDVFDLASFTVINMAPENTDFLSWSNYAKVRVINMDVSPFPDNLAEMIISTTCGYGQDTTPGSSDSPTQFTEKPTARPSVQPTVYPTMQPSALPTAAPSQKCPCNPSKSWNDIFLLFDGSNDLAENKFAQLVNYVFSAMTQLTIGQAAQYQTRAGIITYGDNASLLSNLDHYSDTDSFLDDIDNVKRTNTEGTNVVGAITIASDSFKTSAHRTASRKVMIIGASTYRNGNYESPIVKATTFKDNGGIIIVIAYGDLNGDVAAELQQIASPGYYIDSTKKLPTVQQLINLICSANCFCPTTYSPDATTNRGNPDDGCYQTSTLEATNQLAKHYCSREHQGKLSTVITPAQQIFVSKDVTGKEPIYVGLERSHGQWTWADGTPFTGAINDNGGDCATLTRVKGFKTQFDSVQCKMPYLYSCQATPCSTEVFCTQF